METNEYQDAYYQLKDDVKENLPFPMDDDSEQD